MGMPLPAGPRTGGYPLRVLFVEDDPADVEPSLRELRKAWFDVEGDVVDTPEALVERVKAKPYDLVLADYRLPGWTALDALERLRVEGIDVPPILVTGVIGEEGTLECLRRGVTDFVIQGHWERLPSAVSRALGERGQREARRRAEEALRLSEASQRSLIEHASYGIGRASFSRGRFLEVNPALAAMLGCENEEEALGLSLTQGFAFDPAALESVLRRESAIDAEFEWKRKDGVPIAVRLTGRASRDGSGAPAEFQFVAEDITSRKQAERRIAQVKRLYAISSEISQAIVRIRDRGALFQEVCRIAVEKGFFRMAWMGLVDERTGKVRPTSHSGHEDGYLEHIRISTDEEVQGDGPTGSAARSGAHCICDDVATDPRMAPWREEALKRGYRSTGGFPIRIGGRSIAVLTLYAPEPGFFDQENVELLDQLAADVSFALGSMEVEARRKRAEEELEQLFQLSLDLLCIAGFDGRAKRLNPAWEQTLGRPLATLEGRHLLRLVHPDDRRAVIAEFGKLTAGASTEWFEVRIRAQDGSYRSLVANATPVPERGSIYVVARDVTERAQAQNALARLAAVVEASDDAIVSTSLSGVVTTWNSGAERIYGYSAPEVVGRPVSLLIPKDRLEEMQKQLAKIRRGDSVRNHETVRVRKDGRRIHVSLTLSPIRNGGAAPIGVSAISRDITSHKRLENQLRAKNEELERQNRNVREANRVKNQFLANMSHELRSPLNGIIGFTELMHDGKLGAVSEEHKEYLGDILSSARHLLQLINDVLDLAKVESGRIEFRPEPVALARLVREVADVLRAIAAQKQIVIEADVPPELNVAVLDPARFKQVLYNYLSNALKFTPEGGQVRARIRPEGAGQFRLEVEDNGIGIAADEIPNLFVEFRQLDTSAAKKYQGSGLGLALTKRIVEAQGGRVGVESQPGRGSLFFAVLPRVPGPAPAEAHIGPAVLIVDGDRGEASGLAPALRKAGYAVEAADGGAEALARCRERQYAGVAIGLLFAEGDPWQLLHAIRSTGPNSRTPVVMLSAEERDSCSVLAIHDFLTQPLDTQELLGSLEQAGIRAGGALPILVVGNHADVARRVQAALEQGGYRAVCRTSSESALATAIEHAPAAVLIELLTPEMEGVEFLADFRRTPHGRRTPVIALAGQEVCEHDQDDLRRLAFVLGRKAPAGAEALLDALNLAARGTAAG